MRALSLYQPWASLIAHGVKRVETRTWLTKYRGDVAIHATKSEVKGFGAGVIPYHRLPQGVATPHACLLAVVCIDDCILMDEENIPTFSELERELGNYKPGNWAWILSNVRLLREPVPAQGYQGIWPVKPSTERAVLDQIGS